MTLIKFASAAVLDARIARQGTGLVKDAHRHEFDYEPRPGFLYVRSRAISSRTNDNFDHFPAAEIKKAYRTFIGKPVFVNHHNDNHRRARGVIVDAALHEDVNPDGSEDTWTEVLMEVDAVRFPKLAQAILAGEIDRTSMGTDVAFSVCSVCNNKASTPLEYCQHIPRLKGKKVRRRTASGSTEDVLVYEKCYGLGFFENSLLVEEPADPTAYFLGVDARGLQTAASKKSAITLEEPLSAIERAFVAEHPDTVVLPAPGVEAPPGEAYLSLDPPHHRPVRPWEREAMSKAAAKEAGFADWFFSDDNWACEACGYDKNAAEHEICQKCWAPSPVYDFLVAASRKEALGETLAPAQVDTLRDESCPVCGESDSYDGDRCQVCQFVKPPDEFMDPDLEKAKQVDLRQDQQAQTQTTQDGLADPNQAQDGTLQEGAADPDRPWLSKELPAGGPDPAAGTGKPWEQKERPKADASASSEEEDQAKPWTLKTRRKSAG